MGEIAKQTVSTTFWATVEKFGLMGIQFVVGMVLARLLAPSDYGVIALLLVFIAIAQVFVDSGFGSALIRKKDCNNDDYSTAFYFNIVVGLVCYLLLFIAAPWISEFYDTEILIPVLRVYGLTLVLGSMTIVQNAILTQRLEFKKMARCNIVSSLLSGVIALCLAYLGFGVWALVFQTIICSMLTLFSLSICTKWRPILQFSKKSFNYLWSFGSRALVSSLISSLYANIYPLVIGKFYTQADLGFFNRGHHTAALAPNIVSSVFNKSTLPLMAKVQDDRAALIVLYRKFTQLVAFISFPLVFMMFAVAKPFILLSLTDKWAESIPYVQIFSISALTGAVGMINLNLLIALGRTDLTLQANIIKKSVGFVVVGLLVFTSPMTLAVGCMLLDMCIYFVNLYYAKKVVDLKYSTQLKDLMPYLLASIVMGAIVFIPVLLMPNYLSQLVGGVIVGLLSYFLITYFLIRSPFYHQIYDMIKKKGYEQGRTC